MRLTWAVLAIALGACSDDGMPDSTPGRTGRTDISIESDTPIGSECFIECGITEPFLVGTREELSVHMHGQLDANSPALPELRAASSDPSVMTVVEHPCCIAAGVGQGNACTDRATYDRCIANGGSPGSLFDMVVEFHAPGTAHLVLYSADNPLFDQFVLEAHDAASVAIQRQNAADGFAFETVDSLETLDKATLRLVARDRDGQVLFGIRGGTMTIDGDAASFYGKWTSTDQQTYEQTYTELWRMKGGDAVLSGRAGSATVSVPVSTR